METKHAYKLVTTEGETVLLFRKDRAEGLAKHKGWKLTVITLTEGYAIARQGMANALAR